MMTIVLTALGVLVALAARDGILLATKLIIAKRIAKMQEVEAERFREIQGKIQKWMDEYKPEEYGDATEFSLQVCKKCENLRKNIIEDGVCLECVVNGTQ